MVGKKGKPSRAEQIQQLRSNEAFTFSSLQAIFAEESGELRMPFDKDMENLVCIFNNWREYYLCWRLDDPMRTDELKREEAVDCLLDLLPRAKLRGSTLPAQIRENILQEIDNALEALDRLKRSRKKVLFWEDPNTKVMSWKDIRGVIVQDIRTALQKSNSEAPLGISDDSPIALLVAAVLPQITGDMLEPATIRRGLRARRS